jgi:hypothetical protein
VAAATGLGIFTPPLAIFTARRLRRPRTLRCSGSRSPTPRTGRPEAR